MKLKTRRFMRRPFIVKGVEVTEQNIDDVAEWCDGVVIETRQPAADGQETEPELCVRVPVKNARSIRQTEARIGSWVLRLKDGGSYGFKVYTPEWMVRTFVEVDDDDRDEDTVDLRSGDTVVKQRGPASNRVDNVRPLPAQGRTPTPLTVFRA